ncbi:nucleoside deaminase [Terrabacter sp. C0L_2]|uniref:nucleoside deaminase n=1 Tax=Terrabacter sp. C0L_2 TaxID=3108389 RepID=UPI002ED2C287|nr:nucleoside deaminase [Terrabacter sp. C0L_2]
MSIDATDLGHLRRAVELARLALERGDEPFGSVLVSGDGEVLFEDHNHVLALDATQHPEFAIARWAGAHLDPDERAAATVYTSGEHCPMCSAAHAWVGLGRIVYAVSSAQLGAWRSAWGAPPSPVAPLSIVDVVPGAVVDGPAPQLEEEVRDLHRRFAHLHPASPA